MLHRSLTLIGLLGVLLAVGPGCSVERAAVTPEGLLQVLGPLAGFSPTRLSHDWVVESAGKITERQLRAVTKDGRSALRVSNARKPFIIVRRTKAMLLSTPYLSWSWNIEPPAPAGFHPVRIVVGFHGGDPAGGSWGGRALTWLGSRLPAYDRAIALTWGRSALQRGTLELSPGVAPGYTVRGGRENAGRWWSEDVDLADLYARAWPGDDASRVQIAFIGIAAAAGQRPATAYISAIRLSK